MYQSVCAYHTTDTDMSVSLATPLGCSVWGWERGSGWEVPVVVFGAGGGGGGGRVPMAWPETLTCQCLWHHHRAVVASPGSQMRLTLTVCLFCDFTASMSFYTSVMPITIEKHNTIPLVRKISI